MVANKFIIWFKNKWVAPGSSLTHFVYVNHAVGEIFMIDIKYIKLRAIYVFYTAGVFLGNFEPCFAWTLSYGDCGNYVSPRPINPKGSMDHEKKQTFE